jgi:hypothetical protein
MLDLATRKELATLVYERAEDESENQANLTTLADDGEEHFAPTRPWYDALFRYPSTLAW